MRKYYYLLILFICISANATIKQQLIDMETIYTQRHKSLTLNLAFEYTEDIYYFYTVLTSNKSGEKLVLDSVQVKSSSYNTRRLYKIIFSYLNDKDLYIVYDKFGSLQLVHYHFTASKTFERTEHLIGYYPAGLGGGHTQAVFGHLTINNKLYFYLDAGSSLISEQKGLFSLDLATSQLRKMTFNDKPKVVVAVYVKDKNIFDNLAYRFLTEDDLERINRTKKFMEKPYYLYEISYDEERQKKELDEILSVWSLEKFPTFEKTREEVDKEEEKGLDSSWNRDLSKSKERKRSEKFIREILSFTGNKMSGKYKLVDFLYEGYRNYPEYVKMYYFFCLDERNQVQIIRYDMYENLWYIGSFEETDFEPQIDIYKSPDSEL